MKTNSFSAVTATVAGLLLASPASSFAAQAVVSNLEAPGNLSARVTDPAGVPLAAGCLARLLVFPGKSPAEVAALASSGLESLLAGSQAFGAPSFVGAGAAQPGRLEFEAGQGLAQPQGGLHLLVLDSAAPATATGFLLLRLPLVLPADELTGPEAYAAVHLADAEVVFGTRNAAGFATAPAGSPSGYEIWIGGLLGEGYSDEDRHPDADPDHDGRANLIEYATGTSPAHSTPAECLKLERDANGVARVIYLRRGGDDGILCRIDYRPTLAEGVWAGLESAITYPSVVPFPAPDGCEWVGQALPAGDRGFVRLRVEASP